MTLNYFSYLNDFSRLAKAFFYKPAINYFHILISFFISCITNKIHTSKYPFAISIEPSSICNMKCPECLSGMNKIKRKNKFMNMRLFEKILSEVSRRSFYLNLYFQGEPFLNKNIFEMVKTANDKKFYTVISTNGYFLQEDNNQKIIESRLDRLIVSLDGISSGTYSDYRRSGDFEKVVDGIKNLAKKKRENKAFSPYIVLQFLVHKKNEHEIPFLKEYAKKLGVDSISLKAMQFYNEDSIETMSPANKKYNRYIKDKRGRWHIKKKRSSYCYRLWSQMVITTDGDVAPCCYDKIPSFLLGNVNNKSINTIWKSKETNSFRRSVINKDRSINICDNCNG